MSGISSFKEKILRFTRDQKEKDYENLQGIHTILFSNLAAFLDAGLLDSIYVEVEKDFRYTFNNPEKPVEQLGDPLTDGMRLSKGTGEVTYVTTRGKEQKLKLEWCASLVKGTERIIVSIEGEWKPGFTGYERFGSVCNPGQNINTFPDFQALMNEHLANNNLALLDWCTCESDVRVSFEIL